MIKCKPGEVRVIKNISLETRGDTAKPNASKKIMIVHFLCTLCILLCDRLETGPGLVSRLWVLVGAQGL